MQRQDKAAIHQIVSEYLDRDNTGLLKTKFAEYVATVRAEVWRDAIRVAQLSAQKSQKASLDIAAAEILIRRLELAARTGKVEG